MQFWCSGELCNGCKGNSDWRNNGQDVSLYRIRILNCGASEAEAHEKVVRCFYI